MSATNTIHRISLPTLVLAFLVTAASAQVTTKTWNGASGGNWDNAANWLPIGVPGPDHDVVIGGDKGEIVVDKVPIKIRSLNVGDSTNACGTVLKAPPSAPLQIEARKWGAAVGTQDGKITNGKKNKILTANVTAGSVGPLTLRASCNLTNKGIICGGDGNGKTNMTHKPTTGGEVFIKSPTICNDDGVTKGTIKGGDGGNYTDVIGNGSGCGQGGTRGGDVTLDGTTLKKGNVKGGAPGGGVVAPRPHNAGRSTWRGQQITVLPGDLFEGSSIYMKCDGTLDLGGSTAGSFLATTGTIRIDAAGNDIVLTGIPAGTDVFQSDHVTFDGNLVLDPGVTIDDLCTGNVHLGACAGGVVDMLLPTQSFETSSIFAAPQEWTTQIITGPNWIFDDPPHLNLDPKWCSVALIDADMNGPNPVQAILDTPTFDAAGITDSILLEWDQWHQSSANSTVEVFVIEGQNSTPVFFDNQGTPEGDHVVIDITALVATASDALVRFQYTASDQSFWVIDNVEIRVEAPTNGGQAPVPGIALFDFGDARNVNGFPVESGEDGPYFATASTVEPATCYFEGQPLQPIYFLGGFVMQDVIEIAPFGSLDLDDVVLLANGTEPGFLNNLFITNNAGFQALTFNVPPLLVGETLGFQAIITSPSIISFTNAVEVSFTD